MFGSVVKARLASVVFWPAVVVPLLGNACCYNRAAVCVPETGPDFALYDPSYEDDGVWEEEVTALETLFNRFGWTYERLGPDEINAGGLAEDGRPKYRALIVPGGYAYPRNRDLDTDGEANVRAFVAAGGSYVGFCAGAYGAASTVSWAESASGAGGVYNRHADYVAYPYELQLFPAVAQGPFGWTPWAGGTRASLEPVALNRAVPTIAAIGLPESTRFFYYGGPVFAPLEPAPEGYEVWARAVKPANAPAEASTGDGQPSIIRFRVGQGDVILFSYHPDVLIGSDVDGVTLTGAIKESEVAWDTGDQTQDEINLHSWNIVHAALQIAADEPVTPLTGLP